jgi:signal transduction histidine kinase
MVDNFIDQSIKSFSGPASQDQYTALANPFLSLNGLEFPWALYADASGERGIDLLASNHVISFPSYIDRHVALSNKQPESEMIEEKLRKGIIESLRGTPFDQGREIRLKRIDSHNGYSGLICLIPMADESVDESQFVAASKSLLNQQPYLRGVLAQNAFLTSALLRVQGIFQRVTRADFHHVKTSRHKVPPVDSLLLKRRTSTQRMVKAIREIFQASRCALLIPTEEQSNLWRYLVADGFPDEILSSVVAKGDGLTGKIFECKQHDIVISDDIENDSKWSQRWGSTFKRTESEDEDLPLSFLGVPLFPRLDLSARIQSARAGLVLIRPCSRDNFKGAFRKEELLVAGQIANVLAYTLDTFESRLQNLRERRWFSVLDNIESSRLPKQTVYRRLLEQMLHVLPEVNMLLSVVDSHRTLISGKAALGRFSEGIVAETNRPLWDREPHQKNDKDEIDDKEDSLSRFVRLKHRKPLVVDPKAVNDPFARALHANTETRYGMKHKHLFIPLLDDSLRSIGVIIAVSDKSPDWIQGLNLADIEFFAGHVGRCLARHLEKNERSNRESVVASLQHAFKKFGFDGWTIDRVSEQLLHDICKTFDFSCGVVYKLDEQNNVLRGIAGYRVNYTFVRRTLYQTDLDPVARDAAPSLVLEVYHTKKAVMIDRMDDERVNQMDRHRVGIPKHHTGVGIPLLNGSNIQGVLILSYRTRCKPELPVPGLTHELLRWLHKVGEVLGAVFSVADMFLAKDRDTRVRIAQTTIMAQIEHLLQWEEEKGNNDNGLLEFAEHFRGQLTTIVEDAARIFEAHLAGIFLSDTPTAVPKSTYQIEDTLRHLGNKQFFLVAGTGYRSSAFYSADRSGDILSYKASIRGLTSHVLLSLLPQRTQDVSSDYRWSKKAKSFLNIHDDERDGSELEEETTQEQAEEVQEQPRTWMGIPICFDDGESRQLYGAITFTRLRRFRKDRMSFNEQDVAAGLSIAAMLAVVFREKQEVGRISRLIDSLLKTFRHESAGDLIGLVRENFCTISDIDKQRNENEDQDRIQTHCLAGSQCLELVQSIFDAYASFANRSKTWDSSRDYSLEHLFNPVISAAKLHAKAAGVEFDVLNMNERIKVSIDRSKSRYILFAIIRNAIKSCMKKGKLFRKVTVRFTLDEDQSWFAIEVADNGVGIPESDKDAVFVEGFSSFDGTGLGLSMVQRFTEIAKHGSATGSCSFAASGIENEGTCCRVQLPLPRKEERVDESSVDIRG